MSNGKRGEKQNPKSEALTNKSSSTPGSEADVTLFWGAMPSPMGPATPLNGNTGEACFLHRSFLFLFFISGVPASGASFAVRHSQLPLKPSILGNRVDAKRRTKKWSPLFDGFDGFRRIRQIRRAHTGAAATVSIARERRQGSAQKWWGQERCRQDCGRGAKTAKKNSRNQEREGPIIASDKAGARVGTCREAFGLDLKAGVHGKHKHISRHVAHRMSTYK